MTEQDQNEKNRNHRLEDSYSLPENQTKHAAEDAYVVDREKMKIEKLHEINFNEGCKKLSGEE
jgi:hypothetical protein